MERGDESRDGEQRREESRERERDVGSDIPLPARAKIISLGLERRNVQAD